MLSFFRKFHKIGCEITQPLLTALGLFDFCNHMKVAKKGKKVHIQVLGGTINSIKSRIYDHGFTFLHFQNLIGSKSTYVLKYVGLNPS